MYIDLAKYDVDPLHAVHGPEADTWLQCLDEQSVAASETLHSLELIEPSLRAPLSLFGHTVLAVS